MLFTSLHFLIFFPIVVLIYFSIPHRFRWILLLISSYYFYMSWKAEYAILLLVSSLIDYFAALEIHKSENKSKRKIILILALSGNLALLFAFKYLNFFSEQTRLLLNHFSIAHHIPALNILLPIGISFYTFQSMSYSIDVYTRKIEPTKHLGPYMVYTSFFPQLVAGPISRAGNLLPQFFEKHNFDYERIVNGLKIALWGFFLKVVIADRLAIVVDQVYNNVSNYAGIPLILASYFFAFQVYCDFAGYSFIAIGTAQILGITIMDNFKRPYLAKNISEFWRRWHISLSTWFRDYIFTPLYLYTKRKKYLMTLTAQTQHNMSFLTSTFIGVTLLGLWHGADWKFILFGMYHGTLVPLYYFTSKYWNKMYKPLQILLTFNLVVFSLIIFRANSISDLIYIITHLFTNIAYVVLHFYQIGTGQGIIGIFLGLDKAELLIALISISFLVFIELVREKISLLQTLNTKPVIIRWSCYLGIIFAILLFGMFSGRQFIYFQF